MKTVTIIGSHGYRGRYGGWDQLVNNLVDLKQQTYKINVVSPRENKLISVKDKLISIKYFPISGFGFWGLILDYIAALIFAPISHSFLLLGAKSIPAALIAKYLFRVKLIVNVGGVEWERPQYGRFVKTYLRVCFRLSIKYADTVILDNEHYKIFLNSNDDLSNICVIPYGGDIDYSIEKADLTHKYAFLNQTFYLSISRSIADNQLEELCEQFSIMPDHQLVLISNLSKTEYGRTVYEKYCSYQNITLIDGLYDKPELDAIRRSCHAYIHTHTLCGSAPSLIEMIVCRKPIYSFDVPQNRFTLHEECMYFSDFSELAANLGVNMTSPSSSLSNQYIWSDIVRQYESLLI